MCNCKLQTKFQVRKHDENAHKSHAAAAARIKQMYLFCNNAAHMYDDANDAPVFDGNTMAVDQTHTHTHMMGRGHPIAAFWRVSNCLLVWRRAQIRGT